MSAKHARPARSRTVLRTAGTAAGPAGRRLATAAIILAAGAAPVAAAASAQADSVLGTAPGSSSVDAGALPEIDNTPLSLGGLTTPLTQTLPETIMPGVQNLPVLGSALPLVAGVPSLTDALPVGAVAGVPIDGLPVGQLLPRSAPMPRAASPLGNVGTLGNTDGLGNLGDLGNVGGLGNGLGTLNALGSGAMSAGVPVALGAAQTSLAATADTASGTVGDLAASLPNGGLTGISGLATGVTPQSDALTGMVIQQAKPVVDQLQQSGVPTVGGLTNQLGQTPLPAVGTVGRVTQTLPITTVLGTSNPLADTLNSTTEL